MFVEHVLSLSLIKEKFLTCCISENISLSGVSTLLKGEVTYVHQWTKKICWWQHSCWCGHPCWTVCEQGNRQRRHLRPPGWELSMNLKTASSKNSIVPKLAEIWKGKMILRLKKRWLEMDFDVWIWTLDGGGLTLSARLSRQPRQPKYWVALACRVRPAQTFPFT